MGFFRLPAFRPNGDEVVPLVEMLLNQRFESSDNGLSELPAVLTITQFRPFVSNGWKNMRIIFAALARQIYWYQGAARSARQFGRRNRRGKRATEQFNSDGGGSWRAVHE